MPDFRQIRACVFDAYGTLFDIRSAVGRYRVRLGEAADRVSDTWRSKQLEYTWLRSLMERHRDFAGVTADALEYALEEGGIRDDSLRDSLLDAYLELDCYPEVPDVLQTLKKSGLQTSILSNGSLDMLQAAVTHAGLEKQIDRILSVESVGVFKPHPSVYKLAVDALKLRSDEILFISSNAWDAFGAAAFGLTVVWVNRFEQQPELLPEKPDVELTSLSGLPELLGV